MSGIPAAFAQGNGEALSPAQAQQRIDSIIEETRQIDGKEPNELLQSVREGLKLAQTQEAYSSKLELLKNGSKIVEAAGDLKLSEKFLDLALELTQDLNNPALQVEVLILHGELLARHFDYETATHYLHSAQKLCEEIGDQRLMIEIEEKLAINYAMLKEGEQAESHAALALKAAQISKEESAIARSYQTKAIVTLISMDVYRHETAEYIKLATQEFLRKASPEEGRPPVPIAVHDMIDKALERFQQSNDTRGIASCYQLKADIARSTQNLPLALEYYEKAIERCESLGNDSLCIQPEVGLAIVEAFQQNDKIAYQRIDSVIARSGKAVNVPWLLLLKARIASHNSDDSLALDSLNEGIRTAHSLSNPFQLSALYRQRSQVGANLGEYEESIASLDLAYTYELKVAEALSERKIAILKKQTADLEQSAANQSNQGEQQARDPSHSYMFYLKISWILGAILLLICLIVLVIRTKRQKRAQKQLRQSEQEIDALKNTLSKAVSEKNTIIKNIAQEMRTPMNGIIGSIPLINDTTMTPLQENCVNIIDVSSRAILTLINDISDLSTLDSGAFKLAHDPIDLVRLIETVAQLFVSDSEQTQVELLCDMPSDPIPTVMGDTNRIYQILITLIGRSFQTTFEGHVSVKLEPMTPKSDGQLDVRITVEDSGMGIEGKTVDQIFEISPTLTNINSLRRPASMLGMAICKKLIEAMQGSITVKTRKEKGLKVVVVLPLKLEKKEAIWNQGKSFDRFPEKRALIVTASPANQTLLTKHLRAWSLETEHQAEWENAMETLEQSPEFDTIILDISADESESEILEKINRVRRSEKGSEVPIVLLTPGSDFSAGQNLKRQKYIHLLAKSLQVRGLHHCIHQAVVYKSPLTQSYASLTPEDQSGEEFSQVPRMDPNTGFQFIPYILPFSKETKINKDLKILLVEDNAVNLKVTSLMLKKIGYDIDMVSNGKEALQRIEKDRYNVILMDKVMPEMDGLETTLRIRKMTNIEQPIIIALTASASMEDEIACRNATMDNFLAKPVQFEKMKAALAFASGVLEQRWQEQSENS